MPRPTILVAFGITGDLMRLKVLPALYELFAASRLPDRFRIIGFSRKGWSDEDLRAYVRELLLARGKELPPDTLDRFLSLFSFVSGDFAEPSGYEILKSAIAKIESAWGMCANKLFYLSVSPKFYRAVSDDLAISGLTETCDDDSAWTHVVVEKPFGENQASATDIEAILGKSFDERQLYRIDHYLGKEMLQNILPFRFANNLFEERWGRETIESVDIRLYENLGAEKRGAFYDHVGALRDVGQNHALAMLALVAMGRPAARTSDAIRDARAAALETLVVPTETDVRATSARGQYEGYRSIDGVDPSSETETYFRVRAQLDSDRWRGVPFTLEGGKRLGEPLKEIVIRFRPDAHGLFPDAPGNVLSIRLEPAEEIVMTFTAKKPGLAEDYGARQFRFSLREPHERVQYTEEYERLLLDCLHGDQTRFVSKREVQAMWRFVDPIIRAWNDPSAVPLVRYPAGARDFITALP